MRESGVPQGVPGGVNIDFKPLDTADGERIRALEAGEDLTVTNHTFNASYIWQDRYETKNASVCGCSVMKYIYDGGSHYGFPVGGSDGDKTEAVRRLARFVYGTDGNADREGNLSLSVISEKNAALLEKNFHGLFEIEASPDADDYIYTREKLALLKGRHLASKRNFIKRLESEGELTAEPLTEENLAAAMKLEQDWLRGREDDFTAIEEKRALERAVGSYGELGLRGVLLRLDGEPTAFSIGTPMSSDMIDVLFEKAVSGKKGAYEAVNQAFAKLECEGFTYINREEDMGLPALRRAKSSYRPDMKARKFAADANGYFFADESDDESVISLWKEAFGDSEDYIRTFLENHRSGSRIIAKSALTREEREAFLTGNRAENLPKEKAQIAAMACLIPAVLHVNGGKRECLYLYACATEEKSRGRGMMPELINHVQELYGLPLVLRPGSEALAGFYGKLGFKGFLKKDTYTQQRGAAADTKEDRFTVPDAAEYKAARDRFYAEDGYVEWNEDAIGYALLENAENGGSAARSAETGAIILYRVKEKDGEKEVLLRECIGKREDIEAAAEQLMRDTGSVRAVYENPGGMLRMPEGESIAQNGNDFGFYLNLALD